MGELDRSTFLLLLLARSLLRNVSLSLARLRSWLCVIFSTAFTRACRRLDRFVPHLALALSLLGQYPALLATCATLQTLLGTLSLATMAPIRVAAVQVGSPAFDLAASIGKLEDYVAMAAQGGAKFVVFPEAYLSAYPRFLSFEIGRRTDENRNWYRRYVESSVKVPDGAEGVDWLSTEAGERGEVRRNCCVQLQSEAA